MIWLYDDSFDGLLTAIFEAFAYKGESSIAPLVRAEPSFFDCTEVVTDPTKADRVLKGMRKLDNELPDVVYNAFLSQLPGVEDAALATLRLGFRTKKSPLPLRQISCVWTLLDASRKVGGQAHKYKGLLRMHRIGEDLYIADFEPDYHILPLLGQHFHTRYSDSRVIIRDLRRKLAVISDPDGWHIAPLAEHELQPFAKEREVIEQWRGYFKAIANPHRKNLKLQRQFVSKKTRKYITEFNDE